MTFKYFPSDKIIIAGWKCRADITELSRFEIRRKVVFSLNRKLGMF